ncbi:MAG TPA: DnaJ C-terminal domain-containing protein [Burkholderiales bacterium]|nr:DnaJ C-terminal domain-containing protein [Burkholderiales bacterium]
MKYKDYYEILGVARDGSDADIKKAYRKLAQKYHPDVSKEKDAEAKFKDIGEAYQTLKDPEKKAAYDNLGSHRPGEDFQPPPDWGQQFRHDGGAGGFSFEDIDLSDLFANLGAGGFRAGGRGGKFPIPGQDYEVEAPITIEDAFRGAELDLNLSVPEYDEQGRMRRVPLTFKARIPKGVTDGERLRLPGKGGKGVNGGPDGNLFLTIRLQPHRVFRADGHDLYLDLPIAPWEAALGASVEVPTLAGPVRLKVPAGTNTGQKLRLGKRGLPKRKEGEGDLFAIVQIVVPPASSEREQALYRDLAAASNFNPREAFATGAAA